MRVAIFWMQSDEGWQPIEILREESKSDVRVRLAEWRHILSASNTDVAKTIAEVELPQEKE